MAATPSTSPKTASASAEAELKVTIDNKRPFGLRDKIGYALGDAGNNFSFNMVNTFLMIFYTNVFGLPGAAVGGLFFAARFIDAIADVTIGRLADNSPLTAAGRFRPWIFRMKYPLLIAVILLFVPAVRFLPYTGRLVYVFITYLAFGILYSSVNIPYGSMASVISNEPKHKTSLSTWRSIGAAVGSAIVSYCLPIFMYVGDSTTIDPNRFFIVASICACLGFLCYVGLYYMSTERVRTEKSKPIPLGKMLVDMFKNKALVVLVVIDIVVVINQNLSGTTLSYLFNDYFQNKTALSIALIMNYVTVLVLAPFASILVDKFGRKATCVATLAWGAVVYGAGLIIHTTNPIVCIVILFLGSLGAGMFNLMVWAFITDVIDNQEVLFGAREDGIVYGMNSFARKMAQAIAGGFGGVMLTVIGYQSSTTGGAQQTAEVVDRIYYLTFGIPTACCAIAALIMFFFYPLSKKKVNENARILRERAAAGE